MSKTREDIVNSTQVVFDMDDTMIDAKGAVVLNTPMLDALIEKNLFNISFLSSMNSATLSNDLADVEAGKKNYTRKKLIDAVTNYRSEKFPDFKGFTVHNIITLNDLAYKKSDKSPLGRYYATEWQKAYNDLENKINAKKLSGNDLAKAIAKYNVDKTSDEKQYNDVEDAIKAILNSNKDLNKEDRKALEMKLKAERHDNLDVLKWLSENRQETKGKVFELIIDHRETIRKPNKNTPNITPNSFIYFDDLGKELGAVAAANKAANNPVALTVVEVQGWQGPSYKGDFVLLKEKDPVQLAKNEAMLNARYKNQIESHLTRLESEKTFTQSHVTEFTKKEFTEAWNKALGGEGNAPAPVIVTEKTTAPVKSQEAVSSASIEPARPRSHQQPTPEAAASATSSPHIQRRNALSRQNAKDLEKPEMTRKQKVKSGLGAGMNLFSPKPEAAVPEEKRKISNSESASTSSEQEPESPKKTT